VYPVDVVVTRCVAALRRETEQALAAVPVSDSSATAPADDDELCVCSLR
jgi:hypothetical protein